MNITITSPRRPSLPVFAAQLERRSTMIGQEPERHRSSRPPLEPKASAAFRGYLGQLVADITDLDSSRSITL